MNYLCPACAEPITGELVQYHELLAHRPCADSLERAFSPYRKWALSLITHGNSGAPELCAIVRDYADFLDYDEIAFDIVRQSSAMPGDICSDPDKVRIIGQVASNFSMLVPTEDSRISIDDALREDALTCAKISHHALGLIAENCLNEEQLSFTRQIRRSLVHSEPIDIRAYDADAMAFAMVDEYFDTRRAPFHARKKWVPSPCGLGYVDEPRFHSVRRIPRTWLCVILAAYGITREVVRILAGGGPKLERLQLYSTWKLSEGGMIRLNRDVLRQFYLATLPVLFVQPETVIDPRLIHGACVIAPIFPGLDTIITEEKLATFSDLLQARALAAR
jgi:hypothetical protein